MTPVTSPLEVLIQHPLAQQDLVEPSAQGQEFEEALFGDLADHETDLVHVAWPASPWGKESCLSFRR